MALVLRQPVMRYDVIKKIVCIGSVGVPVGCPVTSAL